MQRLVGAAGAVEVTVEKMDIYARAIDQLSSVAALQFGAVRLYSSAEDELKLDALEKAYARAREKAAVLARASGQKLGEALQVSESSGPAIHYAEAGLMRMAASDKAAIEPGTVGIRASVNVRFALD